MDEEGTNFCGVTLRIEESVLASRPMVAAVERLTPAPAAAADGDRQGSCRPSFCDEIRFVRNELTINAEDALECAINLTGSVFLRLQLPYRGVNERA